MGIDNDFNTPLLREFATTSYHRRDATSTLKTIVAPGSNTNGIVINSISLATDSGQITRVMIKTSAPSTWADGIGIAAIEDVSHLLAMGLPAIVPAGYGLYEQSASAVNALVDINYEVL